MTGFALTCEELTPILNDVKDQVIRAAQAHGLLGQAEAAEMCLRIRVVARPQGFWGALVAKIKGEDPPQGGFLVETLVLADCREGVGAAPGIRTAHEVPR